jgi:putative colanic acid biosynthesis acetyltransferase WcaB
MSLLSDIQEDLRVNSHIKSKVILIMFRISNRTYEFPVYLKPVGLVVRFAYRFIVDWVMGVDIPCATRIGKRLTIYHGFGLVINEAAIIGNDCVLRHGVTIGNKIVGGVESGAPSIQDCVEFGAGAVVIGAVNIGCGSVIGANTVVTKSLEPNSIVVGSPSRLLDS